MRFDGAMARRPKPPLDEKRLQGFKYLRLVEQYLDGLHRVGCEGDTAGNRRLHMDQYCRLVLLFLFNPQCDSLHAIQQASLLRKVQRKLAVRPTSMGSLSESVHSFGAERLQDLIDQLMARLPSVPQSTPAGELDCIITAVDGTLLKNLPRLVEALWMGSEHPAFKAHVQLEVLGGRPAAVQLTDGAGNEKTVLEGALQAGRLYLLDRGYFKYSLFQRILDAGSSFCCRMQDYAKVEVVEERLLSQSSLDQGVVRDAVVRLGDRSNNRALRQPLRIVTVTRTECGTSQRNARARRPQTEAMTIVTDRMDLEPDVIVWLYCLRWEIETFFRFFKHTLGCDHLLSHDENGVRVQVYLAIIACLLMALFVGHRPDKATRRMLNWYLTGLADAEELQAFLDRKNAR